MLSESCALFAFSRSFGAPELGDSDVLGSKADCSDDCQCVL